MIGRQGSLGLQFWGHWITFLLSSLIAVVLMSSNELLQWVLMQEPKWYLGADAGRLGMRPVCCEHPWAPQQAKVHQGNKTDGCAVGFACTSLSLLSYRSAAFFYFTYPDSSVLSGELCFSADWPRWPWSRVPSSTYLWCENGLSDHQRGAATYFSFRFPRWRQLG